MTLFQMRLCIAKSLLESIKKGSIEYAVISDQSWDGVGMELVFMGCSYASAFVFIEICAYHVHFSSYLKISPLSPSSFTHHPNYTYRRVPDQKLDPRLPPHNNLCKIQDWD